MVREENRKKMDRGQDGEREREREILRKGDEESWSMIFAIGLWKWSICLLCLSATTPSLGNWLSWLEIQHVLCNLKGTYLHQPKYLKSLL